MTVELEFDCTNRNCAFTGGAFRKEGKNVLLCAGVNPTGTVAVAGVTDTRIPESSATIAVPVFFLSASAVAVNVRIGTNGFGKFARDGAVYVSTFEPFAVVIVHVPMLPVRP
jgi:hypothetical protein